MTESIREVAVTIEVDTNKQTKKAELHLAEDEGLKEFGKRVAQKLSELTEST